MVFLFQCFLSCFFSLRPGLASFFLDLHYEFCVDETWKLKSLTCLPNLLSSYRRHVIKTRMS